MFISRKQYDFLLHHSFGWVQKHWKNFQREWSIGGVRVSGPQEELVELKRRLPLIIR